MKRHRSWLFIPGSNENMLKKADLVSADAIIYDLEDSVELSSKKAARSLVKKHIKNLKNSSSYTVVRINACDTSFFSNDIETIVDANLTGLMIPKSEDPYIFKELDLLISELEKKRSIEKGRIQIIPLIETALGVTRSFEIASSTKRIARLAFGAVDYTKDIQAELSTVGSELLFARGKIINDSYAARIGGPIDTVFTDLQNMEGLKSETKKIKNMGFQGKLVIHPKQIPIVNDVFTPNITKIQEAKRLVKAYEEAKEKKLGVIQLNGRMIDVPVVEHARRLVQLYEDLT